MQTTSIKCFMHAHNFIFMITGIAMVAVGATAKSHYYPYYTFLGDRYFSLPNLLIVTGSIIFFTGLLGTYGTVKEKWNIPTAKTASRRYCVLMIMIFIFELSVSIAGFVLRDKTSTYIENTLYAKMNGYEKTDIRTVWDVIQQEFECCGVQNYSDWKTLFRNDSLPISCCKLTSSAVTVGTFYCSSLQQPVVIIEPSTTIEPTEKPPSNDSQKQEAVNSESSDSDITYLYFTTKPYSSGCHSLFSEFVKKYAINIGAVGTSFAILQLGGVFVSIHLARQFKNTYYTTFYI